MKRIIITTLILSIALGMLSFVPALIVTALLDLDSGYAMIYSLLMTAGAMVFLPLPFSLSARRERKEIMRISKKFGKNSFVCRVMIDTRSNMVSGYIGFDNTDMRLFGVIGKKEYDVLVSDNADAVVNFTESAEVVIRTVRKKEYRILASNTDVLQRALKALGWRIVEESEVDEDE